MTAPESMNLEEQVADLTSRLNVMEQIMRQRDAIIAKAVMETLKNGDVMEEYLTRFVAAAEAEWTGNFLPEIRRLLQRRLETVEEHLGLNQDGAE